MAYGPSVSVTRLSKEVIGRKRMPLKLDGSVRHISRTNACPPSLEFGSAAGLHRIDCFGYTSRLVVVL